MSNKFRINNGLIYTDGNQSNGHVLTSDASGNATWQASSGSGSTVWSLNGNALVSGTEVLGTTNTFDLIIITDNTQRLKIDTAGWVSFPGGSTTRRLFVDDTLGGNGSQLDVVAGQSLQIGGLGGNLYLAGGASSIGIGGDVLIEGGLGASFVYGNLWLAPTGGLVGVGTNAPTDTLHVNGTFKLVDGTQSNGYVLKTDGNGLASWQIPDGTGNTVFYVTTYFTGNTSATCVTDLFVSNINSCSPLHINNLNSGPVLISEGGGILGVGLHLTGVTTATTALYVGDNSGNSDITIKGGQGKLRTLSVDNGDSPSNYEGANFQILGGAGFNAVGSGELRLLGGPGGDGGAVVINGGISVGNVYNNVQIQPYLGTFSATGVVTIGNVSASNSLLTIQHTNGSTQFRLHTPYTPTTSGDTSGVQGQIAWDDNYFYVKTNYGGGAWGRLNLDYAF